MSETAAAPSILLTGTITFLAAGIDRRAGPAAGVLGHPDVHAILRAHGGRWSAAASDDQIVAVYDSAVGAVAAALDLRSTVRRLGGAEPRIALHTGEARVRGDGRHIGTAVRRAVDLAEIANGGQVLISASTAAAVRDLLPDGVSLVDLGPHRLRDLSSPIRVYALRSAEAAADRRPLRSLDRVPNNLPMQLTSFVGRTAELNAVHNLLGEHRLVTLTGVGGAGKTRLAAHAAAGQADRWPDGLRWVPLETVTDSAQVAAAVAEAVGVLVEPVRGPLRSLTLQLRDRRMLLCLDNCEHVLEGAAETVEALLRCCPEVAVLTTSREPLGLPGEAVWRVPPLGAEDALALFVERASLVRPWFTLDASTEAAVRTMCARLDGLPLALELAAAWLRTLTPQQIEAGLHDRFRLLVRSARGTVPRQQTLAASIDWSHALLEEADRVVFRRLAVFAGGFTLAAARSVAAAAPVIGEQVLTCVARLVDKSLIVAEERGGEARYRLLETIRQYAADRLDAAGEVAATRDRHLDHFLACAEELEPERARDMDAWRVRLEAEHDNLRAALDWGLAAPDPRRGRRLAAALPWLWHLHRHGREGIDYLQRAIRRDPDDRSTLQARLLTGVALVADTASPLDLEFDAAQRALEIATERGDERLRALCLVLSAVGQFYTDFDAAWALSTEALQAADDALITHAARALQGIILHLRDRHAEANPVLRSAAEGLSRRHRGIAATVLANLACGALYTGEIDAAGRLAAAAVEMAQPLGDYLRVGSTRSVQALVHGLAGDAVAGWRVMQPVLRLVEGAEDDVFVPGLARTIGFLHLRCGEPAPAAAWFARDARSTDRGTETVLAAQALPGWGAALAALGRHDEARKVLDRAVAVGRRLGMPRVVAEALEQQGLAADDLDRSIELQHEALALRVEHGLRTFYVDSLDALATLDARAEPSVEVVRILAASEEGRRQLGHPREPARQPAHDAAVAALRAAFGDRPFREAWAEGARLTVDEAVGYVRRARGRRRRPSTGWASLTPAERDVVRLVIEGLNNPQIGARLFMSRSTVKTHLGHVYAKLGVANRTELAALATAREAAGSAGGGSGGSADP